MLAFWIQELGKTEMARMGIIVLTASGNAVWYARLFEWARVLQETCDAELTLRAPPSVGRSAAPLLRRKASLYVSGLVHAPLQMEDLFDVEPDVLVVLASGVSDLWLLPEINLPKAKKTVLCLMELWLKELDEQMPLLRAQVKKFSHFAIGWGGSMQRCKALLREDVAFISDATDVIAQSAARERVARPDVLQVLSYGRTHRAQYEALRQAWVDGHIRYRFDSLGGWMCSVPLEDHRRKLLEELAASHYVVANHAKFDDPVLTSRQKLEFGPRFAKIAAAGAIPVGDFSEQQLLEDLGLRGISIPVAQADRMVDRLRSVTDPERQAICTQNLLAVLDRHDWAHRTQDLLELLEEEASPELSRRRQVLKQLRQRVSAADGAVH